MAQQINLYDPTLKRRREWLTLGYLVLVSFLLAFVVAALGVLARLEQAPLAKRSTENESQLKALREQIAALGQASAEKKPDPALEEMLAARRQLLEVRTAVRELLRHSLVGEAAIPYAEALRGLARQHLPGLWLTGFSLDGQGGMEIRGRANDPALLPAYIRRLNQEAAFKGRAFAALKLEPGKPEAPTGAAAGTLQPAGIRVPWYEFTLIPFKAEEPPVKAEEPPARPASAGRAG